MSKIIELVQDKAINGKPITRKIKGYDCLHHHWTKDFGIIDSCCDLNKVYHKDCKFMKNPRECKHFVCQKKLIEEV